MHLLDIRASRMSPNQVLFTLHADYIGDDYYHSPIARTASIPTQKDSTSAWLSSHFTASFVVSR
jgi:hypothetical protein